MGRGIDMACSLSSIYQALAFPGRDGLLVRAGWGKCAPFGSAKLLNVGSLVATAIIQFDRHPSRRDDVYNILWAVVFGFATLNILSLAARRFEPNRRGMSFGELLAVLIVLLSIFLLGWELMSVFHIFPTKLNR
jgi:hypothetical protein